MSPLVELDESEVLPRRKPRQEADLDITPMIDITFLLLIFFLVTSHMQSEAIRTLPEAVHGTQVSARDAAVITILATSDEGDVQIYLGDSLDPRNLVSDRDLEQQEQLIADYVSQAFAGVTSEGGMPKRHVLIKGEGTVPSGEVQRVARAASRGQEVEISPVFIGVQEKK